MAFMRLVRSFSSVKMRSTPYPSLGISTTVQWTRFLQIVSIDGLTSASTHLPSIFFLSISGSRSYLTMETVSCAMSASSRAPLVELLDHTLNGWRFTMLLIDEISDSTAVLCLYLSRAYPGGRGSEHSSLNHPQSSSVVSEIALAMSSSSHGFKVIETSHFTDFTS